VLIGELDGTPQAALSLTDGRAIANPFLATAPLLDRLQMRACALGASQHTPSLAARIGAAPSGAVLTRPVPAV
jgi:hypothetical protein